MFVLKVLQKYPKVFNGLGEFPRQYHISLQPDALPHIQPFRRVPKVLLERFKTKLDQLDDQSVIRKVENPTEWVNPLVIVEKKNNDLRLCLEPKYLNQAIQREYFPIPTANEIATQLCNKSFFTVLDVMTYEIFGYIQGVGLYFDDKIITGASEQEHDYNLKLVLERALKYNLKFNEKKNTI